MHFLVILSRKIRLNCLDNTKMFFLISGDEKAKGILEERSCEKETVNQLSRWLYIDEKMNINAEVNVIIKSL